LIHLIFGSKCSFVPALAPIQVGGVVAESGIYCANFFHVGTGLVEIFKVR
jgi:hypothetical protein